MLNLFKSKKSVKETIERIHKEFYTASDNLIKEANDILARDGAKKAGRLKNAGFVNCREVMYFDYAVIPFSILGSIRYYQINYPNNKFITEDQVEKINAKYNLVCGPVSRYKGFVPENKLSQIEKFNIREVDKPEVFITNVEFSYTSTDASEIRNIKKRYPNGIYPASECSNFKRTWMKLGGADVKSFDEIDNSGLLICAPQKDMNLKGLDKVGAVFASLLKVNIPDPVVLQPVKGGFLIVAAWGLEASDEIVVNEAQN